MTDLAIRYPGVEIGGAGFDLALDGSALATDDGLVTAIIISLFTDARARADDVLPAPGDRRGWWGDALPVVARDQIGSRLWLLAREKRLQTVVARARTYAIEALAWLSIDGVVERIDVTADALGDRTLAIGVEVVRPAGPGRQRYDFVWDATSVDLDVRKAA